MTGLDPCHVEWCRSHFRSLAEGGTWALPSTGLIFTKRGTNLNLIGRMPYMAEMPISKRKFDREQQHVLDQTVAHFAAVGVTVVDKT